MKSDELEKFLERDEVQVTHAENLRMNQFLIWMTDWEKKGLFLSKEVR